MGAHVRHLTGAPNWRKTNENLFAEHEGLRFFVYHPLEHIDRAAMAADAKRLRTDVGGFLSRSGMADILRPEAIQSYARDLKQRTGFAFYRGVNADLRPGVNLSPAAEAPQPQDFRSFVGEMQRQALRPPTLGGVINSYDPMLTRQEIVANFAYGDPCEACNVPFLLPFQLTDMHSYVDAHERFHGSFTLKLEHAYHDGYFSSPASDMIKTAQHEKAGRDVGEWSTPYGKYIEENVVDTAAMLLHLREGGDPAFIHLVADTRASALREIGDFDHDTADSLYALAQKGRDPQFVQGLRQLDVHDLTDVAVRHTAEHIRPKAQHYGMMKYAASGQGMFSDKKSAKLLAEVEAHTQKWEWQGMPTPDDKRAWHAMNSRADEAQDRLSDDDEKFARCQAFFPQLRGMSMAQQEAFMIELEERALMAHLTEEYPHLNNAADRLMLLTHRRERLLGLADLDADEKEYFDAQLDVIDLMRREEQVMLELEGVAQLDDSYRTPEGQTAFLRAKLREAQALTRGGERPMVEPQVIEGLLARQAPLENEPENEPALAQAGRG